jgi:hypothetical protein
MPAVRMATRREGFPSWSWLGTDGISTVNTDWRPGEVSDTNYRFRVPVVDKGLVDWCDFVRKGGLSLQPSISGPSLQIDGWVFRIGPFLKATFPPQQFYYIPEMDFGIGDTSTKNANVLKFSSDFGTASPGSFLTDLFEAISTYTYGNGDYAIVFERVGGIGRRIGLLDLRVCTLTDRGIPFAIPQRSCNIVRSFNARWENICLR